MRIGSGSSRPLGSKIAAILLGCANLVGQAPPPVKSATPLKTAGVSIQGILAGPDGIPLQLDATQLLMTRVFAIPVPKDEERAVKVTMRAEDLNRFHAQPDGQGRFRLRINRAEVPKDKKLRLLLMLPVSGSGLQGLRKDDRDILIDLATAPANLNLGKVTVGSTQP